MDISTSINSFSTDYSLNTINDYNKYLQGQASFDFNTDLNEFDKILETTTKSNPLKTQAANDGLGNFADNVSSSIGNALNSVNNMRLEADRMQEDIAMGGSTNIHDAMIAAEKADLSMKMAVQIRNRVLDAYTQITSMSL